MGATRDFGLWKTERQGNEQLYITREWRKSRPPKKDMW